MLTPQMPILYILSPFTGLICWVVQIHPPPKKKHSLLHYEQAYMHPPSLPIHLHMQLNAKYSGLLNQSFSRHLTQEAVVEAIPTRKMRKHFRMKDHIKLSSCLASYLEYGLMVRHSSSSIRHYNDWQVVTILRKGSCSTSHTEGFGKALKVLLAENGIHQLDYLILEGAT